MSGGVSKKIVLLISGPRLPNPRVSGFTRQTFCQKKQERVEKRLRADNVKVSASAMKLVREMGEGS